MNPPGSFGAWLRHRRRELDLTQEALAGQVGCARITIRKLEDGKMRPSKELAAFLLERLGVPPEERENFVRYARRGVFPFSLTPPTTSNNIPNPISSFIGRKHELADVKKSAQQARLVTITGTGGIGKTRLAIEAARMLLDSFSDGVWWIELAAVHDPTMVIGAMAKALNVTELPHQQLEEAVVNLLRSKKILIVLDNCEHLITVCAHIAKRILSACAEVKLLTTSREPLGLTGEVIYRLAPLSLPSAEQLPSNDSLFQYEATRLFTERASAVNQHFSVTAENAHVAIQICRHLDGMPLAIELAAARVGTLSLEQIAARLNGHISILTDGHRITSSHHQTLRATIDWSYNLLTEAEQGLFRQLAVFIGGFDLDALESVASVTSDQTVFDVLSRIVEKSLVAVEYQKNTRYHLLETIRQYALEKLDESESTHLFRDRHLDYFARLAEEAERHYFSPQQRDWRNRLDLELNNLRAALNWSLESGQIKTGLKLAGALADFWFNKGYLSEGNQWLEKMLAADDKSPTTEKAKALHFASMISRQLGENNRAKDHAELSLRMCRELGDQRGAGLALADLGAVFHLEGNRAQAQEFLEEGLQLLQSSGDLWGIAYTQLWLGDTWFRMGDIARAAPHWEASLRFASESGDSRLLAWSLGGLADIARLHGDYERAMDMNKKALTIYQEQGNRSEPPFTLEALGLIAAAHGQLQRAARLWGAASAWRKTINAPLPSSYEADYTPSIAQARTQLGEKLFESAWSEGHDMSYEQAIEYALERQNS